MRYLTLGERFEYEAELIKGSRFRAVLLPARDEVTAMAAVRSIEAEHPDVDHCCWAWRLKGGSTRTWDAAEPRGSAGRPILAQIEGHEVFDLVVAVLRDFGGTKLGVGGLVRAYGGTAGMALDRAPLREVAETLSLQITHSYGDTGIIDAVLTGAPVVVVSTDWGESVSRVLRVEADAVQTLVSTLRDRTAGRVNGIVSD